MFCYSKEIPKKRQKNKIIEDAKKEKKKRSEECHKSHFAAYILTLSVMSYDSCVLMLVLPKRPPID